MAAPQLHDVIRADAQINIIIGTGFYEKILHALMHIIGERSEAEMADARIKIAAGTADEPWMVAAETMTILCQEIEQQAKKQGFVQQKIAVDPEAVGMGIS